MSQFYQFPEAARKICPNGIIKLHFEDQKSSHPQGHVPFVKTWGEFAPCHSHIPVPLKVPGLWLHKTEAPLPCHLFPICISL